MCRRWLFAPVRLFGFFFSSFPCPPPLPLPLSDLGVKLGRIMQLQWLAARDDATLLSPQVVANSRQCFFYKYTEQSTRYLRGMVLRECSAIPKA